MKKPLLTLCFVLALTGAFAQKSERSHTVLRPAQQSAMREMETDRPDVTESPVSLDAGHFQLETDLVANQRQTGDDLTKSAWLLNDMTLKLGLGSHTDLQVRFESFVRETTTDRVSGGKTIESGTGNLTLRIKQNILGNGKGNFALAVLPYVRFPVATYGEKHPYEGGLIIPARLKFGGDWKLGAQLEVDRLEDLDGQGTHTEFLQSLTLSHPLSKKLEGLAETYYTYDFRQHHFSNFVNAALQLEVFKDVKIDGGMNYGIQKDAGKRYFLGLALRI
ncbi:transporter [Pedobacter yulinensis]|uniref:Transporter n=1 Tax=Pedobacter yulinensis TaxID=2126353 RepID=A0A2T3HJF1_9SPHI|nr:transporter [Pedobacter yulinensis]PST82578.1 transporter [Pedobacter yulinensis]